MTERFFVIAAGGTGGHMFPAQALAQEMLRRGWRVALSTDERGMRYADSFPVEVERRKVAAATFSGGGVKGKLSAPFRIFAGVQEATQWFRERRPAMVAGFGGYPSLPALTAAWRLRLPRVIHEQNGVLGRVNRAFATRVHALACGVEPMTNAPAGAPLVLVGNPVRDAVRDLAGAPFPSLEAESPVRLLIFGGSQGARIFSETAPAAIVGLPEALRRRLHVSQQVRTEDFGGIREAYVQAGVRAELSPFFEDMPQRIADSHLVLSRAGASTIAEITAIGRPAILAPYPHATADHQSANAKALAERGAALVTPDAELDVETLRRALLELFTQPDALPRMADAARDLGRPDAARDLADLVERVAGQNASGVKIE